MKKSPVVERLLKNINNIHLLGKQRAFELGNPFYAKYKGDGDFYHKELPTGEVYLVKVEIVTDRDGMPIEIKDTIINEVAR